ncbi:hypothetical protein [Bacillus sp. FJAT-27445]|uniref:hypothetical protein n=1 Tax=Bacillus sp. FJAT-27445 TaxID=1679166 RepID=UPI0007435909|nr:hypothetical protein [Bacillus sp. FJAT-27445]
MAIIPILLLFVMVVAVSHLIARSGKIRLGTPKVTHWLLLGYIGILLIATIISPFLKVERVQGERMPSGTVDRSWENYMQNLYSGRLDQIDDYLAKKETIKDFPFDTLEIVFRGDFGPEILIERDSRLKNEIEIYSYREQLFIGGLDFSSKIKALPYKFNGNQLEIPHTEIRVDVRIFTNSFPVRQFTGEKSNVYTTRGGGSTLYLKVPENLKLQTQGQIGIKEVGE